MEMDKVSVFMRARLGSSRLPKKHLLKIKGKPVIRHLIERAKAHTEIKNLVLCTTDDPEDDALEEIALLCGINCFRGDAENVLKRYYDAGKKYGSKYIVNIDCDDILVDYELLDTTAKLLEFLDVDYLTWKGYPLGCIPTGMKYSAIKALYEETDENVEHISLYFLESKRFNTATIDVFDKNIYRAYFDDIRLTLDYEDDFKLFEKIYDELYETDEHISLKNIIKLFDSKNDILKINSYINKGYFEKFEDFVENKFKQNQKEKGSE